MKKIILGGIAALALIMAPLTVVTAVSAQSTERVTAARCTIADKKLETRITRVAAAKENQSKIYTALKERVDTLITNAEERGYDTAALTAARDEVKAAIEVYVQKATAYDEALKAAKELTCGESDGAYAEAIVAARTALTEVRTASIDVRSAFRTKALPALQEYANWLKEQATTQQENQ